jgi:hypothetical protein
MITIDAAKALGWDDELGSLEPGKKAGVAVVNLRQPHLTPNWMVVHRLIHEAVGHGVETVVVDGQVVLEDRRVLTVDEEAILDAAIHEAWPLVERARVRPASPSATRLPFRRKYPIGCCRSIDSPLVIGDTVGHRGCWLFQASVCPVKVVVQEVQANCVG